LRRGGGGAAAAGRQAAQNQAGRQAEEPSASKAKNRGAKRRRRWQNRALPVREPRYATATNLGKCARTRRVESAHPLTCVAKTARMRGSREDPGGVGEKGARRRYPHAKRGAAKSGAYPCGKRQRVRIQTRAQTRARKPRPRYGGKIRVQRQRQNRAMFMRAR